MKIRMKATIMKTFPVVLVTLCASSLAHSQGQISFGNRNLASTFISTNSAPGGAPTGLISGNVGLYYFALFVSPTGSVSTVTPSLAGWRLSQPPNGAIGTNMATPGRFHGNTPEIGASVVYGYPAGSPADFLIVGWSANIGTTWQEAAAWWNSGDPANGSRTAPAAWFGISTIARGIYLGSSASPPEALFGTLPKQMLGFTLNLHEVPEPSSAVLALLGGLLFWGRVRTSQSRSGREPKNRLHLAVVTPSS